LEKNPVWTLADCEWRAAAPGLSPSVCRAPQTNKQRHAHAGAGHACESLECPVSDEYKSWQPGFLSPPRKCPLRRHCQLATLSSRGHVQTGDTVELGTRLRWGHWRGGDTFRPRTLPSREHVWGADTFAPGTRSDRGHCRDATLSANRHYYRGGDTREVGTRANVSRAQQCPLFERVPGSTMSPADTDVPSKEGTSSGRGHFHFQTGDTLKQAQGTGLSVSTPRKGLHLDRVCTSKVSARPKRPRVVHAWCVAVSPRSDI